MKQIQLPNGDTAIIRNVTKDDAKALIEYVNIISAESDFLTFGEGEFGISVEEEEKFIESISSKNNALFIVAEVEGKIVGNLNFSGGGRPRIEHAGEFGVSVLKEYWGMGIGTELIQYLIAWCRQSNIIRKVNLRTRTDNFTAINIYKKLGFVEEGIITRDAKVNDQFYDSLHMGLLIE